MLLFDKITMFAFTFYCLIEKSFVHISSMTAVKGYRTNTMDFPKNEALFLAIVTQFCNPIAKNKMCFTYENSNFCAILLGAYIENIVKLQTYHDSNKEHHEQSDVACIGTEVTNPRRRFSDFISF